MLKILKYLHGGYKAKEGGDVTYNIKQKKVMRKRIFLFNSCEKDMTCILHKIRVYNQV